MPSTTDDDMMRELEEPPVFATAWIPENPGDVIIGEVVNLSERTTDYGTYPIVTILPDGADEPLAVHCTGTVLSGKVRDEDRPQIGDRYAIRFGGEVTGKNGRAYKSWTTSIRRCPLVPAPATPAPKKSATSKATEKTTVDSDGITF